MLRYNNHEGKKYLKINIYKYFLYFQLSISLLLSVGASAMASPAGVGGIGGGHAGGLVGGHGGGIVGGHGGGIVGGIFQGM